MLATVPDRFASLLDEDPFAPALVLTRIGSRDWIWVRAAVEHRAVRLAGACISRGLATHGRVIFTGSGALDRLAASLFVLSTGRILVDAAEADFAIDDAICRESEVWSNPYMLRCTVQPSDRAAVFTHLLDHGTLFRQAMGRCLAETDAGQAIESLALGEPLLVRGDRAADARHLVYAA